VACLRHRGLRLRLAHPRGGGEEPLAHRGYAARVRWRAATCRDPPGTARRVGACRGTVSGCQTAAREEGRGVANQPRGFCPRLRRGQRWSRRSRRDTRRCNATCPCHDRRGTALHHGDVGTTVRHCHSGEGRRKGGAACRYRGTGSPMDTGGPQKFSRRHPSRAAEPARSCQQTSKRIQWVRAGLGLCASQHRHCTLRHATASHGLWAAQKYHHMWTRRSICRRCRAASGIGAPHPRCRVRSPEEETDMSQDMHTTLSFSPQAGYFRIWPKFSSCFEPGGPGPHGGEQTARPPVSDH